jgi:3-dehydroquinate dehydratase-1
MDGTESVAWPPERFVIAASVADLAREPAARADADLLEFRMDLAEEPLAALSVYDGDLPVLATNRVEREGGAAPAGTRRLDQLTAAVREPAVVAVDVELATVEAGPGERVLSVAETAGVATVVSAHDFEATPERARMRTRLSAATDRGTVGKLAVTATGPGDVLDVLTVTHECTTAGEAVATMAMGAAGRHSRAVAPLYGSRVGYAPVTPAAATAPGQYDLATLAELHERLR